MNIVDALCMKCGKPIRWVSGTPRLCPACSRSGSPGTRRYVVPLNGFQVDSFRLFTCLLLTLVVLAACSGPVNTSKPAVVSVATEQPIILPHVGYRVVQACLDVTGSYPRDDFNLAKQAIADAADASVMPNTDGLLVYTSLITANSWQEENTPLIDVPQIAADPAPPVTLPPPTPTGDPFTDGKELANVNASNAQAQARYQDVLKKQHAELARIRVLVHIQTNRLRSFNPPGGSSTDVFGCIERAAKRLQGVRGDRLLFLASDLQNNSLAEYVSGLDLAGVRVKVIYHYCADAAVCESTDAWFVNLCRHAGAASITFYDVDESKALLPQSLFS